MTRNVNPGTTRILPSPRTRIKNEANKTLSDITEFEKNHHNLVEIDHMTKRELIQLIQKEGFELPGKITWDSERQANVKEKLKKVEYLAFARQKLFSLDLPPIVQKVSDKIQSRTAPLHLFMYIYLIFFETNNFA